MRKNAIHLNEAQMWQIAQYCIEHKGVVQGEDGKWNKFRVSRKLLAEEVSKNLFKSETFKLNDYQVGKSVNFFNTVCEITEKYVVSPPAQESVECDILKVEITKLKVEVERLHKENETNVARYNKIMKDIYNYKETFSEISKLAKGRM